MSVYRRFDAEGYPSLVTANVTGRRPALNRAHAAELFIKVIYDVRGETNFQLLAFVVMPDHSHVVLKPAKEDRMGRVIQLIKGRFARLYNQAAGGGGSFWQSCYHERALRSETELVNAIKYVHANPVAEGLVAEAAAYAWSSAGGRYETDLVTYMGQASA